MEMSGGNQNGAHAERDAPLECGLFVSDRVWQALSGQLSESVFAELHGLLAVASGEVRAGLLRELPELVEEYGDRSVMVALGRICDGTDRVAGVS